MIRLACLLVLASMAAVVLIAVQTTGTNAIVFSFVGTPLLAAGIAVYGIQRWREGAFRSPPPSQRKRSPG